MILKHIYSKKTMYQFLPELPEFYKKILQKHFGLFFPDTV